MFVMSTSTSNFSIFFSLLHTFLLLLSSEFSFSSGISNYLISEAFTAFCLLFLSDLLLQDITTSNVKMLVLVLTSMSCKHNHSKYTLCSGKLTTLIRFVTLIRFPEQTLEMDLEKGKRFSTWVASLEKQPICVFWLITRLGCSTATLSIRKLASFCLSEKDYMFIVKTLLQKQGPDLLIWSSITLRPELIPKT